MKKLTKKLAVVGTSIMSALCLGSIALADATTGSAGFVGALTDSTTGITGENLWTQLTPFVGLFVGIFMFAFVYGRIRKTTGSGSKGKFRM